MSGRWPDELLWWEVQLFVISKVVEGLWVSSVGDTGEMGARWASVPGSASGVELTAVVSMVMVGLMYGSERVSHVSSRVGLGAIRNLYETYGARSARWRRVVILAIRATSFHGYETRAQHGRSDLVSVRLYRGKPRLAEPGERRERGDIK